MIRTLFTVVIGCLLMGCGKNISGTYKMENIMPNLSGLPLPAQQRAQLERGLDGQRTVLEFGPGKRVVIKANGMGSENTYEVDGKQVRIKINPSQFMEFTMDGDTLVGPGSIRYVKQ